VESELAALAERFDLHPLAVEDAVSAHQRPKLDRYDDMPFTVLKTVQHVHSDEPNADVEVVDTGEITVFLGRDYVITVSTVGCMGCAAGWRPDPERLALGPSAVLHAIMDRVMDDYLTAAAELREDVDAVENAVLVRHAWRLEVTGRGADLRAEARGAGDAPGSGPAERSAADARRTADAADRPGHPGVLPRRRRPPVPGQRADRVVRRAAHHDRPSEPGPGHRRAERRHPDDLGLTILAVPTAVAGIYGMNFDHMLELHWRYGYPLIALVTLALCLAPHRGFHRNGWL